MYAFYPFHHCVKNIAFYTNIINVHKHFLTILFLLILNTYVPNMFICTETMQAPWKRLLKTKPTQAASKNMCLQETFSTASDLETPHFHDSHLITKDRLSGFAEKRRRDTFDERETARAAKEKRTELINDSIGSRLTLENKKIDMELELMEVKLQAARKQHEMEVELLKIKTECSRLKHMKLYYEVRKLEKELGVPGETGVNTLMTSAIPVIDALEVNQTQKVYS